MNKLTEIIAHNEKYQIQAITYNETKIAKINLDYICITILKMNTNKRKWYFINKNLIRTSAFGARWKEYEVNF